MYLKQIRRWLFVVYLCTTVAIGIVAFIYANMALTLGPVHLGRVVVSASLAFLVMWTVVLPDLLYFVYVVRTYVNRRIYHNRRNVNIFSSFVVVAPIICIGLSAWDIAHNPQDGATLAIVWAIVAPAIIFVGKGIVTGIFSAIGKSLYESVTRQDDKPAR